MSTANIKLLEHNSSRLLFYSVDAMPNANEFKLTIEDITSTTSDSTYCTEMDNHIYTNNWLLGKLNNKIWYIEDVGVYDSNHEHTAKVYYIDETTNEENIVWNVKRIMEYGEECDRLYCEHSGGFKILLIDSPENELEANFYIKYERNLPGIGEAVGTLTNPTTGETINNCVVFYKYNSSNEVIMTEAIKLDFNLSVINNDGSLMEGINYCNIIPKKADIEFSRLSIKYEISPNTSNDVKLGMIGITTLGESDPYSGYYGKFNSSRYYQDNDNYIEPMYFIVQAPKNRSWICYRSGYCDEYVGFGPYRNHQIDGCYCYYVRGEGFGLNGYYGTYNSSTQRYVYEININPIDNGKVFSVLLPKIFFNYQSVTYKNGSSNTIAFDGEIEDIYNEFDGMIYRVFYLESSSNVRKIILEYSASV